MRGHREKAAPPQIWEGIYSAALLHVVESIVAFKIILADQRRSDDFFYEFLAEVGVRDLDDGADTVRNGLAEDVRHAPLGDEVHGGSVYPPQC